VNSVAGSFGCPLAILEPLSSGIDYPILSLFGNAHHPPESKALQVDPISGVQSDAVAFHEGDGCQGCPGAPENVEPKTKVVNPSIELY